MHRLRLPPNCLGYFDGHEANITLGRGLDLEEWTLRAHGAELLSSVHCESQRTPLSMAPHADFHPDLAGNLSLFSKSFVLHTLCEALQKQPPQP